MDFKHSAIRAWMRTQLLNVLGTFSSPAPYVVILNGHMVDWHHDNDKDGERFARLLAELHRHCDFVNFEDAVRMATRTPAELMGVKKGRLEPGWDADLLIIDDDMEINTVIISGEIFWQRAS